MAQEAGDSLADAAAGAVAAEGQILKGVGALNKVKGLWLTSTYLTDKQKVQETTLQWKDMVTLGTGEAARKTADLYAPDAVLWGTVSEEVRDTPEEIYDYFDYFARLPDLQLSEFTPVVLRVYGDFATEAGTYTFRWQGKDGQLKEKRARFSFTFRKDPESPTSWTIVEHHSSLMPHSPDELKHVIHSEGHVF